MACCRTEIQRCHRSGLRCASPLSPLCAVYSAHSASEGQVQIHAKPTHFTTNATEKKWRLQHIDQPVYLLNAWSCQRCWKYATAVTCGADTLVLKSQATTAASHENFLVPQITAVGKESSAYQQLAC
eukprot:6199770-Pleurochrysis_carterae.AAC.1